VSDRLHQGESKKLITATTKFTCSGNDPI